MTLERSVHYSLIKVLMIPLAIPRGGGGGGGGI